MQCRRGLRIEWSLLLKIWSQCDATEKGKRIAGKWEKDRLEFIGKRLKNVHVCVVCVHFSNVFNLSPKIVMVSMALLINAVRFVYLSTHHTPSDTVIGQLLILFHFNLLEYKHKAVAEYYVMEAEM